MYVREVGARASHEAKIKVEETLKLSDGAMTHSAEEANMGHGAGETRFDNVSERASAAAAPPT